MIDPLNRSGLGGFDRERLGEAGPYAGGRRRIEFHLMGALQPLARAVVDDSDVVASGCGFRILGGQGDVMDARLGGAP